MTDRELYDLYSAWTGQLHFWCVQQLDRHLDCEYFPQTYQFKVYSGWALEYASPASGIPGLSRPPGERSETIALYRPSDYPTALELEELFKAICFAAARVLQIEPDRNRLGVEAPRLENSIAAISEGTQSTGALDRAETGIGRAGPEMDRRARLRPSR